MSDQDIAIVGMAVRLPGAPNLARFREVLLGTASTLTRFSDETLRARGVPDATLNDPAYVKVGAELPFVQDFDPAFWGFSPRDAAILDPQHRAFLEVAHDAFEDAGLDPARFDGAVGVFAGAGPHTYLHRHLLPRRDLVEGVGPFLLRHTGNDKDFLATRLSYLLNLRGPSVNVQTACSTSLVAVHLACQSLLSGECDAALAGGVTIDLPHGVGYRRADGEVTSPTGENRSFDAHSNGTVFSSGAGAVVLRRLADALADGDPIHAVIKATAVNNDGARKVGYLAPSVDGQATAALEALAVSGVDPDEIGFVEAHGTATPIGDPIEVAALTKAFRSRSSRTAFCALGSVKSHVGHTDTAAGVVGLVKAALAVQSGVVPPTVGFTRPNPALRLDRTPFFVNAEAIAWPLPGSRRAAVNSLGVGGTNAFAIVEQPPAAPSPADEARAHLLLLSAKNADALRNRATDLAAFLGDTPSADLRDVAFTTREGRRAFQARGFVVASSTAEAAEHLRGSFPSAPFEEGREVAFLFSGGGAAFAGMANDLYRHLQPFRRHLDAVLDAVQSEADFDARAALFGADDVEWRRPSRNLPLLFAVQVALARTLEAFGVEASALLGHSAGEYVAAHLAGVFTLHDAARVVTARGRLFEDVAAGGMTSVPLGEADVRALLHDTLDVAAVNGPESCVVSGPLAALHVFEEHLRAAGLSPRRLALDVAAHSRLLEPILPRFEAVLRSVHLKAPTRLVWSNLTGTELTAADATDPAYWVRHLRETVRFAAGASALLRRRAVLVEVGPGAVLTSLAALQPEFAHVTATTLPAAKDGRSSHATFLAALGTLWSAGARVDLAALDRDDARPPRKTHLPTYPFQRVRCWFDEARASTLPEAPSRALTLSVPTWRPAPPPIASTAPASVLVLASGNADALSAALSALGASVQIAAFDDPPSAWRARVRAEPFTHVVVAPPQPSGDLDAALSRAFDPLLELGVLLADLPDPPALVILGDHAHVPRVGAASDLGALALGPARVLAADAPSLRVRFVDVAGAPLARVAREVLSHAAPPIVLLRPSGRFTPTFETLDVDRPADVRRGGVYLLTGGLGGVGFELARDLARVPGVRLVVVGRAEPSSPRVRRRTAFLESLGATVTYHAVDVAHEADVRHVVVDTLTRFGALHGVLHAAGTLDDASFLKKTPASARAVISPKVGGALAVLHATRDLDLDFTLLFSSVSAFAGLPGQVDYAAANAALDALARGETERGRRVVSIAWSAWHDVGLARRAERVDVFLRDCDWRFDEHRTLDGTPVLPGMALFSLTAQAWSERAPRPFEGLEWRDVTIVAPLVPNDEDVAVAVSFDGPSFRVACDGVEHASGELRVLAEPLSPVRVPRHLAERLAPAPHDGRAHPHMRFGPRWGVLRARADAPREALLDLALPSGFHGDLVSDALHAALLDVATGAARDLARAVREDGAFLVPFGVTRLRLGRPLPAAFLAHVRLTNESDDTATFDVTLLTRNAERLADVEGFTMRRVPSLDAPPLTPPPHALTPAEGRRAWRLALALDAPHVVVTPAPVEAHLGALHDALRPERPKRAERPSGVRPALAVAFVAPRDALEARIAEAWGDALGLGEVGVLDDFFDLGGHSLLLTSLLGRVRSTLQLRLPLSAAFAHPTVAGWAQASSAAEAPPTPDASGDATDVPLTPNLHRFLVERASPDPHHWNVALLLRPRASVTSGALRSAAHAVYEAHDALRLRFVRDETWRAVLAPATATEGVFDVVDLSALSDEAFERRVPIEAQRVQESFDLSRGPLFKVTFLTGRSTSRVLVVAHHFVADALSFTIVIEDLQRLVGGGVRSAGEGTSFPAWSRALRAYASSPEGERTAPAWLALPWSDVRPLPSSGSGENSNASARTVEVSLAAADVAALSARAPRDVSLADVLAASLARGVARFSGARAALIDFMGHGREETIGRVDLARTVGFLVSYTPLVVRVDGTDAWAAARAARELRASHGGVAFDALRTSGAASPDVEALRRLPRAEVLLNFLGHRREDAGDVLDERVWSLASESAGSTHAPNGRRYYPVAVKGVLHEGSLVLTFVYSEGRNDRDSILALAEDVVDHLTRVARGEAWEPHASTSSA